MRGFINVYFEKAYGKKKKKVNFLISINVLFDYSFFYMFVQVFKL